MPLSRFSELRRGPTAFFCFQVTISCRCVENTRSKTRSCSRDWRWYCLGCWQRRRGDQGRVVGYYALSLNACQYWSCGSWIRDWRWSHTPEDYTLCVPERTPRIDLILLPFFMPYISRGQRRVFGAGKLTSKEIILNEALLGPESNLNFNSTSRPPK